MAIPPALINLGLAILIATLIWYARDVWRWARVLWVCRVPVVSAVGGGLLLAATQQARDCFSDLGLAIWQWGLFLALTFAWAWIVHASARRALLADDWVPEAHCADGLAQNRRSDLREEFKWPAIWVPRLLGLSVLAFVLVALYRARDNLTAARIALAEADEAVRRIDWLAGAMLGVIALYLVWIIVRGTVPPRIDALPPPDGLPPAATSTERAP